MNVKEGTTLKKLVLQINGPDTRREDEEFEKRIKLEVVEQMDRKDALWNGIFDEMVKAKEIPKGAEYKDYVVSVNEAGTEVMAEKKETRFRREASQRNPFFDALEDALMEAHDA